MARDLFQTRRLNDSVLLGTVLVYTAMLFASNLAYHGTPGRWFAKIDHISFGYHVAQLVLPLAAFAAIAPLLFIIGQLRATDIGSHSSDILPAALSMVAFWLFSQVIVAAVAMLGEGRLPGNLAWYYPRFYFIAGLVAQLIGNSLVEEMVFRGFILRQALVRLEGAMPRQLALAVAGFISFALFILSHFPGRLILYRAEIIDILTNADIVIRLGRSIEWIMAVRSIECLFPFALMLTLAYLVTRNIFVCVGLHALWNAQIRLVEAPSQVSEGVWYGVTVFLLVSWWLARIVRSRMIVAVPSGLATGG